MESKEYKDFYSIVWGRSKFIQESWDTSVESCRQALQVQPAHWPEWFSSYELAFLGLARGMGNSWDSDLVRVS